MPEALYPVSYTHLDVYKRQVYLCIRHGTGIEPNVNQVRLAFHRLAVFGNKDDIDVYKRQAVFSRCRYGTQLARAEPARMLPRRERHDRGGAVQDKEPEAGNGDVYKRQV